MFYTVFVFVNPFPPLQVMDIRVMLERIRIEKVELSLQEDSALFIQCVRAHKR